PQPARTPRPNYLATARAAAGDRPEANRGRERGAPDKAPNNARAGDRPASPCTGPGRRAGSTLACPRTADRFHLVAQRLLARSGKSARWMARRRAAARPHRDKTTAREPGAAARWARVGDCQCLLAG